MTLIIPAAREFFDLAPAGPGILAVAACGAALSVTVLFLAGFTPGSGAENYRVDRVLSADGAGPAPP
jgi:hypothetical protein